ncbi:right-handed parallel beta-helix repeat-containing protein [Aporhodopirellula aestuarii]|uniref:Right-handed parallel beta-helix repeat-containing protein n=1 Tax=Aporhodopirellula aestuarii TaxID=2950107 RepID=A0ABT0U0F3_9BACT|nr:right-handed parallel beta-helix repeat-containing protein [Aporhodopirellula aestuarii]MCM2370119.1 right-handed parallel beta-helix repeat-containing protein [Aporhodopirellula aestuarii]
MLVILFSTMKNVRGNTQILLTLLAFMVLFQGPVQAGTTTLFVAPAGNDQWSGRLAEPQKNDGPLATLDAARLKVRQLKTTNPADTIEVQIRGGTYQLRETVVFGPQDSGSQDAPVIYKAFPGETPVFTGGIEISNWKKCAKDPAGVAPEAKGQLWAAEIPRALNEQWNIKSLYDSETLLKRARSNGFHYADVEKENDFNRQGKKLTSVLEYEGEPVAPFDRTVHFRDEDIKDWPNPSDIELILKDRPWLANIIPLERIDTQNRIAHLAVDPTYQAMNPNNRYWVENAIDYLDEPGEWVFSSAEGRLYFWPEGDIKDMHIVAPYLQEFIRVEGTEDGPFVKHLHFEGLTFSHGVRDSLLEGDQGLQHDWEMYDKGNAVVRFRFAEDCDVASCVIRSSSGTGIRLDLHCQRINITRNHLHHLGGGGVVLSGYGPGTKDVNKNNVVHDNYIHDIGELLLHSAAIFVAQSGHNEITHNTIRDVPYNGIVVSGCRPHEFYLVNRIPFRRAWVSSIRFEECEPYIQKGLAAQYHNNLEHFLPLLHARENRISMNDISRVLLQLHDGNAIYFSAMGENNVVENNYLHQNYGTAGTVRLDDNPSFTIIRNNVVRESEQGFGLKGPADLSNNFVFTETFLRGRTLPGWLGGTKQVEPVGNIFMPPASSKSSNGLYLTDSRATDRPFFMNLPKMENSIYFTENTSDSYVPKSELGSDLFTGEQVTLGQDAVKLIYADPMFDTHAAKQGIYRFKNGSPAEKLGIQPIDLRGVGSSLTKPNFKGLDETSGAAAERVLFDFNNKTPFDGASVGASMTVDALTMNTIEIVDIDGVTKGSKLNIHAAYHAVSIRSASGKGDHNHFDVGEAWGFTFDKNIASIELKLAGMDKDDAFKLAIREGAEDIEIDVSLNKMKNGVFTLSQTISAHTPIEIKLIAGDTARIESVAVTAPNH